MTKCISIILLCIFTSSCIKSTDNTITCLQITHRDGLEETISDKRDLLKYANTNFEQPQNFQKIVQYKKKQSHRVSSIMTYHENGTLEALLETKNGRANGRFLQYHDNGALFIQSNVIEGKADLSREAKQSFIFDGPTKVFDSKNNCISQMYYNRGKLEGDVVEFWSNNAIKLKIPYHEGKIHGCISYFNQKNELVGKKHYTHGLKNGMCFKKDKYEEHYDHGLLMKANYFDKKGKVEFSINDGIGFKPIYHQNALQELQEFQEGKKNGLIKCFSKKGHLINNYTMIDNKKEGFEECYFDVAEKKIQLQIPWRGDEIHGIVKAYYPNQKLESQTEMVKSKKNGLCIAYYENASLMLMEKYKEDKLIDGKYYRINENTYTSSIENGEGFATIFDKNGNLLRTLEYKNHKIQMHDDEK